MKKKKERKSSLDKCLFLGYNRSMNNLKELREKKGLSKEELAKKMGVSARSIYRWEEKQHRPHKVFEKKLKRILSD